MSSDHKRDETMGAPEQEHNNKKWIQLQNKKNPHPGSHKVQNILLLDRATCYSFSQLLWLNYRMIFFFETISSDV